LGIYADSAGRPKSDSLWVSDTLTVDASINKVIVPDIAVSGNFFVVLTIIQDTITNKATYWGAEVELPLRPNTFLDRLYSTTTNSWSSIWSDLAASPTAGVVGDTKLMLDVSYGNDLPVKLQSFSATANNKTIAINWHTATELNTRHFKIQHSTDGNSFTDIGTVKAMGSGANGYSFTDNTPANGTNYYRLQSVDKDGSSSYSKVVSVQFTVDRLPLTVVPNPARDVATIKGSHIASVQVIDNIGRVVKVVSLKDATNPVLSVNSLPSGVYHLRVQTTDGNVSGVAIVVN